MFAVLAEANRRRILDLVRERERSVGELVRTLELSQPAVSKHLRVLRDAGLVEARVDAQRRLYRLRPEALREVDDWIAPYRAAWADRLDAWRDTSTGCPTEEETMPHDLGTLQPEGEGWRLVFTRRLPHPREKVWRAVTEPEHLAAWFPQEIVGDRRAGARLRFVTSGAADEGFDGEMLEFDPPRALAMSWGADVLRIELHPDGHGTVLTLTDTFCDLGKAARDAAGWHECLDRLVAALAGAEPPGWGDVWRAVHPAYVEELGPAAATVAPPPG